MKVIESDDEDLPQTGDENAMDTSVPEAEAQKEVVAQTQPAQPTQPTAHQVQSAQAQPPAAHQPAHQQTQQPVLQPVHPPIIHTKMEPHFDLEADISQLEAPTFTTINRGPSEPMLRLRWDHRVNLIGEKVLNPMIHCCDKCLKPILIYGRMVRSAWLFLFR